MSKLEELQPGASVRGVLPDSMATVVSVKWYGSEVLELTYKSASGTVANELVYRDDESHLEVVDQGRPWSFDGIDGDGVQHPTLQIILYPNLPRCTCPAKPGPRLRPS